MKSTNGLYQGREDLKSLKLFIEKYHHQELKPGRVETCFKDCPTGYERGARKIKKIRLKKFKRGIERKKDRKKDRQTEKRKKKIKIRFP